MGASNGLLTLWAEASCLDVARDAMRLHTTASAVAKIRAAIDARYGRAPGSRAPTPLLP